jgi:hypothetical protein
MTDPILSCEECGEVHDKMYLHSACHTGTPTWAVYTNSTQELEIRCAECDKLIAKFKVLRLDQ